MITAYDHQFSKAQSSRRNLPGNRDARQETGKIDRVLMAIDVRASDRSFRIRAPFVAIIPTAAR